MKQGIRLLSTIVGVLILMGVACAQDWPQWRGPNRDGKVTGFTVPQTWPQELTQKWKVTVGAGDATPALMGDRLFVFARQGEDEVTLCLNAGDGKELWQNKCAAQAPSGPAGRHPGPRSSPTVAEGKVVTLGAGGILSCLDAATGKEVWRKDEFTKAVPRFYTAMSPIVVDGVCIAHLGGGDNGAIIAFDLPTGAEKWKRVGDGPAYASPVLMTVDGTKQIVEMTDKSIVGVAVADGELLWQIPAVPQRRFYNSATPIVDGSTVIYTGQGQGTKAVKVEKKGDGFAAQELWSNAELGTGYDTPVLKDGLLYGLSDRGNLFCMHSQTGQAAWTNTNRLSSFGAVLDAGAVLVALPEKSGLIVFRPSDKQYEELARISVSETPIYAHPVLAGNRIFVKDQDALTLWTID